MSFPVLGLILGMVSVLYGPCEALAPSLIIPTDTDVLPQTLGLGLGLDLMNL